MTQSPPAARSARFAREHGLGGEARAQRERVGGIPYAWNDNGDLAGKTDSVSGDMWTYDYDAMGYLRSVVLPDGTVLDYEWDAKGHRVGKRRNGVLEKQWLYRRDLQVVAELNGAGVVQKRFVYAEGVNVPELMIQSGNTYRLVKDHLGSVRAVVNQSTGAVAERIDYDAWGRVLADSSPGLTPFGFAGGLYDVETTMVRFGARDYDSHAGRWATTDPLAFPLGGLNRYEYAGSNPYNLVDPRGLTPLSPEDADEPVSKPPGSQVCRGKGDEEPNDDLLRGCQEADYQGPEGREAWCRFQVPKSKKKMREACWAASRDSTRTWNNFCSRYYGGSR